MRLDGCEYSAWLCAFYEVRRLDDVRDPNDVANGWLCDQMSGSLSCWETGWIPNRVVVRLEGIK